jgi:RND family efflux transporter MFP subunit
VVAGLAITILASTLPMACGKSSQSEAHSSSDSSSSGRSTGSGPPGSRGSGSEAESGGPSAAVPVQVAEVRRQTISSFIETNGTLEAENEVDIESRVSAPIVELKVEEGFEVRKGDLLARLDDREFHARAEISRVTLQEAEAASRRAESLRESQLISPEAYDQTVTRLETARAQYKSDLIQLGYTKIEAPFDGLIVARYINLAEQVGSSTPLFRISDFKPLLCPIQVPERELPKLRLGQRAYLTFDAWSEERFQAEILRIRPVVDAATGTVKVTLDVDARGRLRPGMFAKVFVETETRNETLVIPKAALSLESIGDTVYVAEDGVASRRNVTLGFREGDLVEVLSGLEVGESVIVLGQDGLSNGTPVQVLGPLGGSGTALAEAAATGAADRAGQRTGTSGLPPDQKSRFDPDSMTLEQLERTKELMRSRGLSDKEIEERISRARGQSGGG